MHWDSDFIRFRLKIMVKIKKAILNNKMAFTGL